MDKKKLKLKITFNAPVVLTFGIVSLVALILSLITKGFTNKLLFMTYRHTLLSPLTYIRLFTHVIGHADWAHFIGNMSYILLLGPMLEEKYGSGRIGAIMAITAFVTGLINFIIFPNIALCGASGIVFAFILLTSFTSFKEGELPVSVILVAVIYLGQQIFDGLFVKDNISNLSHILGGIVGAVIGYQLNRKPK